MHAIKGGWVGQTFALAKFNESGGKKTRIRRSKEERKALVESFIKKYQKSNNGNFPSLNLTHKEVGGSFYIIREIVREIIQENRVLGPAKLTEGEHNTDQFLEQNPLGSISTAPKTHLPMQSNGSSFSPDHPEDASDVSVPVTGGLTMGSEYKDFESEEIINENVVDVTNGPAKVAEEEHNNDQFLEQNPLGSISTAPKTHLPIQSNGSSFFPSHPEDASDESVHVTAGLTMVSEHEDFESEQIVNVHVVDVTNGTDKAGHLESHVIEPLESDKTGKELAVATSKVTQLTTDIVVETFPLRPVAKPTDSIDGRSSEARKLNEDLDQTENVKVNACLENGSSKHNDMNSSGVSILTHEKEVENNVDLMSEKKSDLADKKVAENILDPLLESSNCSTKETAMHEAHNGAALKASCNDVLTSETNEQSQPIVGEQAINASNGIHPKLHGTYTGSSGVEPTSDSAVVMERKVDVQHVNSNSKKGGNKTLDRINLESWEETSKRAAESETHPLWAIFKSFISAFMKFWSE
ncbi:hypothetical protein PTKIN_Ptkin13bG0204500 [Pterospermum kingtungense]